MKRAQRAARWLAGRPSWVAVAAVALVTLAYLPSLPGPFVLDDHVYVVENAELRSMPLLQAWRLFTAPANPFEYLPVRDLSLRLDLALFGLDPLPFRLHNLLLYAVTCLLLGPLARAAADLHSAPEPGARPGEPRQAAWLATGAVALFAAHPAHVESVAWISGRKDLLSGLFTLLALWLFVTALGKADRLRYLGSALAFLLAVLSKATALPAVLVAWLLALGRTHRHRSWLQPVSRATLAVLPWLVIAAGALALHWTVGRRTGILTAPDDSGTGALKPVLLLGYLVRIALAPLQPRLIYDIGEPGAARIVALALGVAAILAAVAALARWATHRSPAALGVAAFTFFTLPFLQILPLTTWSLVSERFLFLPLLGLALAVAALAVRLPRPRSAAVLVGALFLFGLAGTLARSDDWASPTELLTGTARLSPRHHVAASILIDQVLLPEGRSREALEVAHRVHRAGARRVLERYIEAHLAAETGDTARVARLLKGLPEAVSWNDPILMLQMANLALRAGLPKRAETVYRSVLEQRPNWVQVHYNLGLALHRLGESREAVEHLETAVAGGLATADALNNLGLARRDSGQEPAAEEAFSRALAADATHWHAAYNLARLYLARGEVVPAREILYEARRRALAAGDDPRSVDELLAVTPEP